MPTFRTNPDDSKARIPAALGALRPQLPEIEHDDGYVRSRALIEKMAHDIPADDPSAIPAAKLSAHQAADILRVIAMSDFTGQQESSGLPSAVVGLQLVLQAVEDALRKL